MSCRIANPDQTAQPVAWLGPHATTGGLRVSSNGAVRDFGAAPRDTQSERLELERTRQFELNEIRQTAFQEGFRKAKAETSAEVKDSSDRLAQIMGELAGLKRRVRNEAECEVVKLALAVARRILYRELTSDPDSIQGIVHAALQKLQSRETLRVRVWPGGVHAVESSLVRTNGTPPIAVIPDARLPTGGIIFETNAGELDASVETQLQEIQRGFTDRMALR